jgi:hypothetical protein
MPRTVKIAPEIDAKLYEELVSVAKENGQSQRMVRPEVMAAYRRSNEKYRELYKNWPSDGRACLYDRRGSRRHPPSPD